MKNRWFCLAVAAILCVLFYSYFYLTDDKDAESVQYELKHYKDSVDMATSKVLKLLELREDSLNYVVDSIVLRLENRDKYIRELLNKKYDEKISNYVELAPDKRFELFSKWVSETDSLRR